MNSIKLFLFIFSNILVTCYALFAKDPDATRDVIEIIESRKLKAELHEVTTDDGYILTIHRIVNISLPAKHKRPVILQHGLESSSVDWMIDSPDLGIEYSTVSFEGKVVANNLAFGLIMHEYDVWLPNSRGNRYSRKHLSLDADTDDNYWECSFDEMIKYDLPAVIEYIQEYTKRKTIGYVGHSQGTEIMFGLLAEQPHYAEIIKPAIMLAPIARLKYMKSAMKYLNKIPLFTNVLNYVGGEFMPTSSLIEKSMSKMCLSQVVASMICSNVMFLICGFNSNHLNTSRIHVYVKHATAGTSTQNMMHYTGNWKSGEFRKYDYGYEGNYREYGAPFPPVYDLKKITSKHIALLYSENDWLADPKDVEFIIQEIGASKLLLNYKVPNPDWNHLDFIYGLKAAEYVHIKVVELLSQYRNFL